MSAYRSLPKEYVVIAPSPTSTVVGLVTGNGLGFLPRRRYESTRLIAMPIAIGTPKTTSSVRRTSRIARSTGCSGRVTGPI